MSGGHGKVHWATWHSTPMPTIESYTSDATATTECPLKTCPKGQVFIYGQGYLAKGLTMQPFKAYCLTLRETPERTEAAKTQFTALGLTVEFFIADKHPQGGRYGCWDSHVRIWKLAQERGEDIVVIFEDDVLIGETATALGEAYQEVLRAFEKDPALVGVNFYCVTNPTVQITDRIWTGAALTCCAYVLNVKRLFAAKTEEDLLPDGRHLDCQLWSNPEAKIFVRGGNFLPCLNVRMDLTIPTTNDYGVLGNFAIKVVGYGNWMNLWINIAKVGDKVPGLRPFLVYLIRLVNKMPGC